MKRFGELILDIGGETVKSRKLFTWNIKIRNKSIFARTEEFWNFKILDKYFYGQLNSGFLLISNIQVQRIRRNICN